MPMIYGGCYISRRAIKEDQEFLESQGLSAKQITAIEKYWHKSLCVQGTLMGLSTLVILFFGSLLVLAWEPFWSLVGAGIIKVPSF